MLCEQIDGLAMDSPLGSSLANAFLADHELNWLGRYNLDCRSLFHFVVNCKPF